MASFTEKYRKWIIASVTLISVPALVINYIGSKERNTADVTVGTAFAGEKVTGLEVRNAEVELTFLTSQAMPLLGTQVPIGAAIFGDFRTASSLEDLQARARLSIGFLQAISKQPEIYAVLKREAVRNGMVVDRDRVESVVRNELQMSEATPPEHLNLAREAVGGLLLVQAFANSSAEALKVTRPYLQGIVARQMQGLNLSVTMFGASEFAAGPTSAPTTQGGGQELYDKFKSTLAGNFSTEDPFGFGYMLPDRLRLEYLTISNAELLRAAEARSPNPTPGPNPAYDWDVEAHKYYAQHAADFTDSKVVPNPLKGLTGSDTITQKTTQPFEGARAAILAKLYAARAGQLRQQVLRKITTTMQADFKQFAESPAKPSSLGVRYDSFEYLQKLAERTQADTGIRPGVATLGQRFYSLADLAKLPELAVAKTEQGVDLPSYLLALAKPLVRDGAKPKFDPLATFEPSPPFADAASNVVIARIPEALLERVPAESEVATQVAADNAAVSAQSRVLAAAEAYKAQPTLGPRQAVAVYTLTKETDVPAEFDLSAYSRGVFVTQAFDLLRGDPSVEHPRAVINLPADRKVAVVELLGVRPLSPGVDPAIMQQETLREVQQLQKLLFISNFFDPAKIAERTHFKSAKGDASKT